MTSNSMAPELMMDNQSDSNRSTNTSYIHRYGIPAELYSYYFVSHSVMCFIIILGNLGTLVCFVKYRKLRKQRYALICSLAVSDVLVGLTNGINILWETLRNADQCMTSVSVQISVNIISTVVFISVSHLIIIGIDRWIAVMFPLRYLSVVTVKTTTLMVITSWGLPMICMVPQLLMVIIHNDTSCTANAYNVSTAIMALLLYCVILLMMSSMYGKIWHVAHKQHAQILAQQQISPVEGIHTNSDANKTVLIILCSFACLYLPNILLGVMKIFGQSDSPAMPIITIIAMGCMLANSGVNVFIYALFTHDFKVIFHELFHCRRNEVKAMIM